MTLVSELAGMENHDNVATEKVDENDDKDQEKEETMEIKKGQIDLKKIPLLIALLKKKDEEVPDSIRKHVSEEFGYSASQKAHKKNHNEGAQKTKGIMPVKSLDILQQFRVN